MTEPTKIGILNYPETGGYYDGDPCTCDLSCIMCLGTCGCNACSSACKDRKSERFEDDPNNHNRYM